MKAGSGGGLAGFRALVTPRSRSNSPSLSCTSPSKLSARSKPPMNSPSLKYERFEVSIERGISGLGVVCDESRYDAFLRTSKCFEIHTGWQSFQPNHHAHMRLC
eukprot:scaffold279657_cov30-Tisochrysis_lutea.AAC.3